MKYYFSLLILCSGLSQYEAAKCSEKPANRPEIYFLHIDSYIRYRYATTTVVSKVVNPLNNSQEVSFGMNLPKTAFITSFVMEINGKEYEAYLKGKEEAKEIYDQAVSSGQSAGHVATSSRDSDHFKISVNIEAQGKIKFTLNYEELLERTLGIYKQVINLNPGQTVRDLKVNVYITESSEIKSLFVPEIKVTNEIETEEKENKNVNITRISSNKAVVRYAPSVEDQEKAGGNCFDGQFIVQYDVSRIHPCGQVLVDEGYFVHFYAPVGLNPLRKLVVFVLDISGSMYGRKLVQLKQAMTTILDELRGDDYFSVVGFSTSVTVHNLDSPSESTVLSSDSAEQPATLAMQQAYPATKNYVEKAKQVIGNMTAIGGTDINDAIKTAIILSHNTYEKIKNDLKNKSEEPLEPMIIFLTDGEPTVGITNLNAIRSTVRELNVPRTAIYSLGFGDGADMGFLNKLSLENSGFGKKIYEASDAALQLKNFYKHISSPLLSNVTFSYIPSQVADNSLTKKHFRSLFRGSELIVAGKLVDNVEELQMDVYSISSNGTESCAVQGSKVPLDNTEDSTGINLSGKKQPFGSLERLWAYLTVKQLLEKKDTLDEDNNKEESSKLKETALNLALKYKFVTPLTSLVVVKPNETDAVTELEDASFYTRRTPLFSGMPSHASGLAFARMPIAAPNSGVFLPRTTTFGSSSMKTFALPSYEPVAVEHIFEADLDLLYSSTPPEDINKGNLTLSDLEWLDQILLNNQTMEVSIPVKNLTQIFTISANPGTSTYQNCTDLPGKCTHLVSCILPNFASNLPEFLRYFCPIPGNFVGVCCPL
ncbi:inter-alpha-trypsin inhibitor heavy chain H4-like isoform X3 [Rhodnius prolixus]|uniref:inter-alpha-trypsin inhibitor heavy chain H4-like isoform X3 n=1 Tax=Rhodnius prolixus TaxID=13249 RepID=UPI003D18B10F